MEVLPITQNPARALGSGSSTTPLEETGLAAAAAADEESQTAQGATETPTAVAPADNVQLGGERLGTQSSTQLIVERVLSRVTSTTDATRNFQIDTSGVELTVQSNELSIRDITTQPVTENFSPQAVADRITEGIESTIFDAFVANNPDFTQEQFVEFREQVERGIEIGFEDARDILSGLQALTPELAVDIDETQDLVNSRLGAFFDNVFDSFNTETETVDADTESILEEVSAN